MIRHQSKSRNLFGGSLAGALLLATSLALAGCDDDPPSSPDLPNVPDTPDVSGPNVLTFGAELTELNGSGASGTATFEMSEDGNSFRATVTVNGLDDTLHAQHIHFGNSCPTPAADANGDGFIDVVEGVPSYGPILVSLDDSLEDNRPFQGQFPMGTSINYDESVDLDVLLADLRRPDDDLTDAFVTLGAEDGLGLEGRHVVIHGVLESTNLPRSVVSLPGVPAQVTLPVACGAIDFR